MAGNLVVLSFDGEQTAKTVWGDLGKLEEAGVIEVEDAVIAWRPAAEAPGVSSSMASAGVSTAGSVSLHTMDQSVYDPGKVQIEQTHHPLKKKYAGRGAAIGFVAGLLLGGPIGGLAVGAGIGAISGSMKDAGIKDDFIKQTAAALRPGTSALFILGHADDPSKLIEELRSFKPQVLTTSLDPETEQRLRDELKS
jgi:uncharacterized membrane protein